MRSWLVLKPHSSLNSRPAWICRRGRISLQRITLKVWKMHWLIDWSMYSLIYRSIDWLIEWCGYLLLNGIVYWLIDWLVWCVVSFGWPDKSENSAGFFLPLLFLWVFCSSSSVPRTPIDTARGFGWHQRGIEWRTRRVVPLHIGNQHELHLYGFQCGKGRKRGRFGQCPSGGVIFCTVHLIGATKRHFRPQYPGPHSVLFLLQNPGWIPRRVMGRHRRRERRGIGAVFERARGNGRHQSLRGAAAGPHGKLLLPPDAVFPKRGLEKPRFGLVQSRAVVRGGFGGIARVPAVGDGPADPHDAGGCDGVSRPRRADWRLFDGLSANFWRSLGKWTRLVGGDVLGERWAVDSTVHRWLRLHQSRTVGLFDHTGVGVGWDGVGVGWDGAGGSGKWFSWGGVEFCGRWERGAGSAGADHFFRG